MNDTLPELAVVVLSVGAPPELKSAIQSLLAQSVPLEIVVINSGGGNPRTILADELSHIRLISKQEVLWPGAARNLGIRSTQAPFVAFLASDLIALPGWATERLQIHHKGYKSIASALVNSHPRNLFAWASHISVHGQRLPDVPRRKALRYGASYARSLFEEYGEFRNDLRIGEDTEFHRRMRRKDRPRWTPSVQAVHLNPTTYQDMIRDQFDRGYRSIIHWPTAKGGWLPWRALRRFTSVATLAPRSVKGMDRLLVIAALPLAAICAVAFEIGASRAWRERLSRGEANASPTVAVAILDRDNWKANTDIIVIVDPLYRHLTWIPRDLWIPKLENRINAAFATGGGELLLQTIRKLGFPVMGLLCLRRAATEAALESACVRIPVTEPLRFWYPIEPTRPIEEGRKAVAFDPPEEVLSGERIHQWVGARTAIDGKGSDRDRIRRQGVFLSVLLEHKFSFEQVIRDEALFKVTGINPLNTLKQVSSDWCFSTYGPLKSAVIDGKSVLVKK